MLRPETAVDPCFAHVLIGEPVSTSPEHALVVLWRGKEAPRKLSTRVSADVPLRCIPRTKMAVRAFTPKLGSCEDRDRYPTWATGDSRDDLISLSATRPASPIL
jgi:hypothetical protein